MPIWCSLESVSSSRASTSSRTRSAARTKATRWRRRAADDAERDREVRLAGADRPGDHDVLGALDILAGRELGELRARDALQGIPVELLEGLEVREPRLAQQTRYGAVAAGEHLALEQLQQELLVVPAVVGRLAYELGVVAAHRGHLQLPAVRLDDGRARRLAHGTAATSSWS